MPSFGLRSLTSNKPGYALCHQGNSAQRDGTNHQGSIWHRLIGSFIDAHYRVYRYAEPPFTARGDDICPAWNDSLAKK